MLNNTIISALLNNEAIQEALVNALLQSLGQAPVQAPVQEPVAPSSQETKSPEKKAPFRWSSPVVANFRIEEVGNGRKKTFAICYGKQSKIWKSWTAPSKMAELKISEAISGRNGWVEVDVPFTRQDGTKGSLRRWGHPSKDEALEVLKALPKGFMPETLNDFHEEKEAVDYSDFI